MIPTRVLVLGTAGPHGVVDRSEAVRVAEACGHTAAQVDGCLAGLVHDGLYAERDGQFTPTAAAVAEFGTYLRRIKLSFEQDAAGRGWDRHWRLVSGDQQLGARLLALGGAELGGGLWVSPHNWFDDARREAAELGVAGSLVLASTDDLDVRGERDPKLIAEQLWPVVDVGARYERFLADWAHVPAELEAMRKAKTPPEDTGLLLLTLGMGVAHDELSAGDPFLPPELLPRPWPGRAARELVLRCRKLARNLPGGARLFGFYDNYVLDRLG